MVDSGLMNLAKSKVDVESVDTVVVCPSSHRERMLDAPGQFNLAQRAAYVYPWAHRGSQTVVLLASLAGHCG